MHCHPVEVIILVVELSLESAEKTILKFITHLGLFSVIHGSFFISKLLSDSLISYLCCVWKNENVSPGAFYAISVK